MDRRTFLKCSATIPITGSLGYLAAQADAAPVKVAVIGAKTGPLAPGAAITHFPPYKLWAHEVNARGGLKLTDGQRKIEVIEYDDRTQPPEAIKAVERAATVDKADWIGGVYSTGFNFATAPTFAKYNYPQLTQSCITDQGPALVKKYPNLFLFQTSSTNYARGVIGVLKKLKDRGEIGNKVATVNVADDFGTELAAAGRQLLKDSGFAIVYDKSYPLGTQEYGQIIDEIGFFNPDAFVAWSYWSDTFALTEAAMSKRLALKAYYCAVGVGSQQFFARFGSAAENILGLGGVADSAAMRDFYKRHKEITDVEADYVGSPFCYSMLQALTQAIESVGSIDRMAIADYLCKNSFKTLVGDVSLPGQMLDKMWTVGQWQGSFFPAVAGIGFTNFATVKLKNHW
jgi:branched-chain amino acid transport system substrate-binding protein